MTSADGVNGLYLNGAKKMCQTLQIRKIMVKVIIKLESFLLFQELKRVVFEYDSYLGSGYKY